jgi:CRISPR type III-A-associated RAMP protein Csm5
MEDKKYKLEVCTLTPIHIGSGIFLQYNTDYYTFKDSSDNHLIGIVDDKKVIEVIGDEHLNDWVNCIENGRDIKEFIRQFAPKISPESYAKRVISDFYAGKLNRNITLKECMHDGMGYPYIPGSSIKGAIRTCVFASIMASKDISKINSFEDLKGLERKYLGEDPNSDVFRFLQVGDAIYEKKSEVATM